MILKIDLRKPQILKQVVLLLLEKDLPHPMKSYTECIFPFPYGELSPLLQIPELKIPIFHIYAPCLLYIMCTCRLHHHSLRTSGNVPKIEEWC
jgi:hypothetical protein